MCKPCRYLVSSPFSFQRRNNNNRRALDYYFRSLASIFGSCTLLLLQCLLEEREKKRYPSRERKRKRGGKKEEEGEELSFFSPYVSVTWVSVKWILRDGRDWTLEASPPSKGDNVCTNPFLPRARNAVNNRSSCEISYLTVLFSNGGREGFEQIAINEWPGRNLWRIPMRRLDK